MSHEVFVNNKPHSVKILEKNGNTFLLEIDGKTVKVKLNPVQGKTLMMEINGEVFHANLEKTQRGSVQVTSGGKTFDVQHQPKMSRGNTPPKAESPLLITKKPASGPSIEKGAVTAPIAGRIVLINTSLGKKVEGGECICILEAMKMENEVVAPKTGVVNEIRVSKGAVVNKGDVLVVIS
jgi:biotin carboxyl carrier protein